MTRLKDNMTNIEKIRQEIEFLKELNEGLYTEGDNSYYEGQDNACNHILAFIDSLPKEKPSEDLEEAADKYSEKHGFRVPYDGSNNFYDEVDVKASKEGFVAEAKWQAKQLLKGSPLPEDTVLFQKGVEEGRRLERDDLALSIDDIEKIHVFLYAVKNNKQGVFTFTRLSDEQYKEVLRRFKEAKK